jgi:hypothetical protein
MGNLRGEIPTFPPRNPQEVRQKSAKGGGAGRWKGGHGEE